MDRYFIKQLMAPNQYTIFGLLVLGVLLFFFCFIPHQICMSESDTFLSAKITVFLSLQSPILVSGIFSGIALVLSLIILGINEKYLFIKVRTVIPSLFFLFFLLFSEFDIQMNAGFTGLIFLLLAINSYFVIYEKGNTKKSLFNCFFFLSVGSLFHIHLLYLCAVFLITTIFSGNFKFKHIFAALLGFLAPLIIACAIILGFGYWNEFTDYTLKIIYPTFLPIQQWGYTRIAYFTFFLIMLLVSFAFFLRTNLSYEIKTRRELKLLFGIAFGICLLGTFQMENYFSYYPFYALGISIISGYFFSLEKSKYIHYLLAGFLLVPVALSLYSYWNDFL